MTRLAFDVGDWTDQPFDGTAVLTPEQVAAEAPTFASARLWDPRPLQGTLDQLQTVRKYYDFPGVDTDRYSIDDAQRQVMLSGRELPSSRTRAPPAGSTSGSSTPTASASRWCRSTRSGSRGSAGPLIGNLPPVSVGGRPDDLPAADLLRRATSLVRRRRRPGRTSSTTRPATPTRAARSVRRPLDGDDRDRPRHDPHAPAVRGPVPGPRPAHQRPGHAATASCCSIAAWPTGWS